MGSHARSWPPLALHTHGALACIQATHVHKINLSENIEYSQIKRIKNEYSQMFMSKFNTSKEEIGEFEDRQVEINLPEN